MVLRLSIGVVCYQGIGEYRIDEQHVPRMHEVEFACVKAEFFVSSVTGRGSNG
jgi:hypothetical protein